MKKIVIVNDCSHITEDLLPFLRSAFEINFVPRTRGLWNKTFGLLWRILRSNGDLFVVNYGLQDAWLTRICKSLDVLYLHGSDVRTTMLTQKYGWMIKGNIKNAHKVFVSTEDLLSTVKKVRTDVELLSRPVRLDLFMPKEQYGKPLSAVYFRKWYEKMPLELPGMLLENNIQLTLYDQNYPVAYDCMPDTLKQFDVFVDRFSIDSLSKTALEAQASGLATIDFRHKNCLLDRIRELGDRDFIWEEASRNRKFIEENHGAQVIAEKWINILDECVCTKNGR